MKSTAKKTNFPHTLPYKQRCLKRGHISEVIKEDGGKNNET